MREGVNLSLLEDFRQGWLVPKVGGERGTALIIHLLIDYFSGKGGWSHICLQDCVVEDCSQIQVVLINIQGVRQKCFRV